MDISNLDVAELNALQANINVEIQRKKHEQKQEVVNKVKSLLAEYGMTLDDLPGRTGRRTGPAAGSKVAPKYRNPDDASQTWTGRGRKPLWVVAHLEKGGSMDDVTI